MIKNYLVIVFIFLVSFSFAQKKKEIKKYAIKLITSSETIGKKTSINSKLYYNVSGCLIQEDEYDKDGNLIKVTKYKYNKNADVIEELEYDEKNTLKEKRTMKYNLLGEKVEELVANGNGKQIKKMLYKYDSRGLRTERTTYDSENNLVSTKKIIYSSK